MDGESEYQHILKFGCPFETLYRPYVGTTFDFTLHDGMFSSGRLLIEFAENP